MRGTQGYESGIVCREGIIPAYAGNTCLARLCCHGNGDHPRVCGEHYDGAASTLRPLGSSPRMRGTRRQGRRRPRLPGIIPAYAGNTSHTRKSLTVKWDHPRVCGEHTRVLTDIDQQLGSSPRMRGTLCFHEIVLHDTGIIPAYAGNTVAAAEKEKHIRDHPRVCGEHFARMRFHTFGIGSSPRMRGTHHGNSRAGFSAGIIPAYAGNTYRAVSRPWIFRDHPRVCGEHLVQLPCSNVF